jgi:major membrane immunogen (membrane-anchored lipoprotein)
MTTPYPEPHTSRDFQGLLLPAHPTSGTEDDDDDRDDEHAGENEASVRVDNEGIETPEEFEVDYKDRLGHPEGDDANDEKDEEEMASPER